MAGSAPVPVLMVGLGSIGVSIGRALAAQPWARVIGGVDPAYAGTSLAALLDAPVPKASKVVATVREIAKGPGVAVHCAGSRLATAAPLIAETLNQGYHVVSTCEELFHPLEAHREIAEKLSRTAKRQARTLVAGGVNPGFAMDVWPLTLASSMLRVDRVRVSRTLDASRRRRSFQEKVCLGEPLSSVKRAIKEGNIGHVGLENSARFLADRLGFEIDKVTHKVTPVAALPGTPWAASGRIAGLSESLVLYQGRTRRVELQLTMASGAAPEEDRVELAGVPGLTAVIPGGLPGDICTVAQIVKLVQMVGGAPGLVQVGTPPK